MGFVHPTNQFPGRDARADARTPGFDAYRTPPRRRPPAPRATENELAHVEYYSPGEWPDGGVGSDRVDFGYDGEALCLFLNSRRTQTHHRAISGNFCSATLPKFLLYELRITGKAQRAL